MPEVAEPPPLTAPDKELQAIANQSKDAIAAMFVGPGIVRDGKTIEATTTNPAPKLEEKPKEEPPKTDIPKVDAPKTDALKTDPPKVDAPKTKEDSIQDLRKARDQYEADLKAEKAERARIAAELEELKKRPDPKEFQEKLTAVEKEKLEYQRELQVAALERDPEFRKDYDLKINREALEMKKLLIASGVPEADAHKATASWNQQFFDEKSSEMDSMTRREFEAHWLEAKRLDNERQGKIAQAETTWQERQKQQQELQTKQQEEYQRFLHTERDAVLKEFSDMEGLRGQEELLKGAADVVNASFGFTPRQIMQQIASAHLLSKSVLQKDAELKELKEKMATLEKENADNKEFIKNQHGAVPRIGPSNGDEPLPDKAALANAFLNPTFGGR
jgi:hypothetical protein